MNKSRLYFFLGGMALLAGLLAVSQVLASPLKEETVSFGRFGTVHLYYQSPRPACVVLLISGDGGWKLGVVDMARSLARLDALVAGIDIRAYFTELAKGGGACSYPAGDFEELSKFIQKKQDLPSYMPPVLMGYSSGATLVYAALVQAPSNAFLGGYSLGFCPDLVLSRPFCRGSGLEWDMGQKPNQYIFRPAPTLEVPWVVIQGDADKVCDPKATAAFVKQIKSGRLIALPGVGHGFAVQKNWMPQFVEALHSLISAKKAEPETPVPSLTDLPLIEIPAQAPGKPWLAIHLTGDGGWGVTDKGISRELSRQGIFVAALNSLKYFWTRRTPDEAAHDLERILRHFLASRQDQSAVLIGYSFGADVLPFMVNRLSADMRSRVRLIVLLGPSESAVFEFHLTDWLGVFHRGDTLPVLPELERLKDIRLLCFSGEKDKHTICGRILGDSANVKSISLRTGHRFGRNFSPIARAILEEVELLSRPRNEL